MTRLRALALDRVGSNLDPEVAILRPMGIDVEFASDEREERGHQLSSADGLLLNRATVGAELFDSAPRCRAVVTYGIGHDHIDLAEARSRGVVVMNVPDYCTGEVADHTLALLLALARAIAQGDRFVKAGGWGIEGVSPIHRLSGQVLGLIGYGRIARAVGLRARVFGLEVRAFDPFVSTATAGSDVTLVKSIDELLREADHISLHLPLLPETRQIIDREAVAEMKPGVFLVNTSRGALVDMEALLQGLDSGVIAGAALDVFPNEPPDVGGFTGRNVVLSPHAAYFSIESMLQLKESAARALGDALTGNGARNRLA